MTDQIADILIVDGVRMRTSTNPPLPKNSPLLRLTPEEEILGDCTGCWRGYVATWEIEGDRLYLKAINGPVEGLAPAWRMVGAERIAATWFSGSLQVEWGPPLPHFDLDDKYKAQFKVFEGRVVARKPMREN